MRTARIFIFPLNPVLFPVSRQNGTRFATGERIHRKDDVPARIGWVAPSDPQLWVDNQFHRNAVKLREQISKITGQKVDLNLFISMNSAQISVSITAGTGFSTIQKQLLLEIHDISTWLRVETGRMPALFSPFRYHQLLENTGHNNEKLPG